MSIPTQYTQRNTSNEPREDCRDYLRTGRCKYGASCKYRHPPNVQSGGGLKGPIDPSEPMFPIRPNEPVCQYYMKHGTCKFGQACKYHHPPASTLHNSSAPRFNHAATVVPTANIEPSNYETGAILPQRPDEPNCIYFLKNGRCKYGATCRYHHPMNYHNRRHAHGNDGRPRHPMSANDTGVVQPKLHYVSLPPGTYQQGQFVVADGQLAFLSLDGSTQGQVISVSSHGTNQEMPMVLTATTTSSKPASLSRDVGSTTSSTSIASSFESSIIGSGGSLNTFSVPDQQSARAAHVVHSGARQVPSQNPSDDGVNSLPRVVSTNGNLDGANNVNSSNHAYFDARRQAHATIRYESGGNATTYRGQRSSSFDQTVSRRQQIMTNGIHESTSVPSFGYAQEQHGGVPQPTRPSSTSADYQHYETPSQQRVPLSMRGPPPTTTRGRQKRQSNRQVDDGLSKMTSALLTMLDTPEEVAGEHFQDFDEYPPSQSSTPVIGNHFPSRGGAPQHAQVPNNTVNSNYNINDTLYAPQATQPDYEQEQSSGMHGYHYEAGGEGYGIPRGQSLNQVDRWSHSLDGSQQQMGGASMVHHQSGQPMPMDQNQRAPHSTYEASNSGMYFP